MYNFNLIQFRIRFCTSQSPQLLVTTTPELSRAVAHQGAGESVYVHCKTNLIDIVENVNIWFFSVF